MAEGTLPRAVIDSLCGVLRPQAFRRRARSWHRSRDEVIQVVMLQSSSGTTRDRFKFTVNAGVFSREVAARLGDVIHHPNEIDCHLRVRIGWLMPGGADRWWTVTTEAEAQEAGGQVARAVSEYALPYLDSLLSTEAIVAALRANTPGIGPNAREHYLMLLA